MEAPRPVPAYDRRQAAATWWYCLHCIHASVAEGNIRTHTKNQHDLFEPIQGEDYTNGHHLRILLKRWDDWSLLAVDKFTLALDSLRGADDLIIDAGDRLPDE